MSRTSVLMTVMAFGFMRWKIPDFLSAVMHAYNSSATYQEILDFFGRKHDFSINI